MRLLPLLLFVIGCSGEKPAPEKLPEKKPVVIETPVVPSIPKLEALDLIAQHRNLRGKVIELTTYAQYVEITSDNPDQFTLLSLFHNNFRYGLVQTANQTAPTFRERFGMDETLRLRITIQAVVDIEDEAGNIILRRANLVR